MNTISMQTLAVRSLTMNFMEIWDNVKSQITAKGKTVYNIIGLKKELEKRFALIQETVITMAEQHGGIAQPDGSYQIPPEKQAEMDKVFTEFGREAMEISYNEIRLKAEDDLPIELIDLLYDFIVFEE